MPDPAAIPQLTIGEVVTWGSLAGAGGMGAVIGALKALAKLRVRWNGKGTGNGNPYRQAATGEKLDELARIGREQLHVQRRTLEAVQQGNGDHQVQKVMLEQIERKVCR